MSHNQRRALLAGMIARLTQIIRSHPAPPNGEHGAQEAQVPAGGGEQASDLGIEAHLALHRAFRARMAAKDEAVRA